MTDNVKGEETWEAINLRPEVPDETDEWETVEECDAEANPCDLGYYDETVLEKQAEDGEWTLVGHKPAVQRDWLKVMVKSKQTADSITTATTAKEGAATTSTRIPQSRRTLAQNCSLALKESVAGPSDKGHDSNVEISPDKSKSKAKATATAAKPALKMKSTITITKAGQPSPAPKAAPAEPKVSYGFNLLLLTYLGERLMDFAADAGECVELLSEAIWDELS
ncbi:hypothetical protein F5Y13DRAFT_184720 [Hypoxylon sp. FL1857]|nr:hypothetical protein F5Y13DRAFT_184720 [Hypoxylon sp. FL1857]